ncbi:MAG: glycerol-3-phosphate acyltransferase, partial [Parachlamydiales bacterium]
HLLKKYIDHPPEKRRQKQLHNQKTLSQMLQLLAQGGQIIYLAPSGGRDRKNPDGSIIPAPFDPESIELFYLFTKKARPKTHFYPLALYTYHLLPPPDTTQIEIGEKRETAFAPVRLFFEQEFNMESFDLLHNRLEKRRKRAEAIYQIVQQAYQRLTK